MSGFKDREKAEQDRALRIMDALSGVDGALLERSALEKDRENTCRCRENRRRGEKPIWRYGRAWAAVFCFAAVGIMAWSGYRYQESAKNASGGSPGLAGGYTTGAAETSSSSERILENSGEAGAGQSMGAIVEDSTVQDSGAIAEGADHTEQAPGRGVLEESTGEPESSETGTMQGESLPSAESSVGKESGTGGIIVDEACGMPPDTWESLTEEEARGMEKGCYLPSAIPQGYGFESAGWSPEDGKLRAGWSRGLDYIELTICVPDAETETADISLPEMYDVRLYEIPYGETVPGEYREIFDDPVFAWEDMSLEIVKCRMITCQDRGDTATPRGNFSVLFSDGVLVRFRGRGTAEQIWAMFCSMGT